MLDSWRKGPLVLELMATTDKTVRALREEIPRYAVVKDKIRIRHGLRILRIVRDLSGLARLHSDLMMRPIRRLVGGPGPRAKPRVLRSLS